MHGNSGNGRNLEMRARYPLAFVAAAAGILACIPHPDGDFEDFSERASAFGPSLEGGSFEAAAPPTEAVTGLYYGACLSQLAFGQPNLVFNFYTETTFTPEPGGGGKLGLSLQALALKEGEKAPPTTVSKAGAVGDKKDVPATAPNVAAADGRYSIELGLTTIPGEANPITGRPVVIEAAKLSGFFGTERFCARLNGNVTQPVPLTLDPERNVCQFVPVKDGDPTPTFTKDDFLPGACPL